MRPSRAAMMFARVFGTIGVAVALAACSGNIGGGESSLPGTPQGGPNTVQSVGAAAGPTPTPVAASNVATLSANSGPQLLPAVAGWSGTIVFPAPSAAPSPSPNPKASPASGDGVAAANATAGASVGITASIVEPTDAPHFGSTSRKRHAKRDKTEPAGLFFISLLATADVSFAQYPKIEIDVPREIAAQYPDGIFALALFDPQQKTRSYALGAAQRDMTAGSAVSAVPAATPVPPAAFATPAQPFGPGSLTPPPVGSGVGLPPEPMTFLAPASALTLRQNRPAVFALYVVAPSPSPSPSPSGSPVASPAPAAPSPSAAPRSSGAPSTSVPSAPPLGVR